MSKFLLLGLSPLLLISAYYLAQIIYYLFIRGLGYTIFNCLTLWAKPETLKRKFAERPLLIVFHLTVLILFLWPLDGIRKMLGAKSMSNQTWEWTVPFKFRRLAP